MSLFATIQKRIPVSFLANVYNVLVKICIHSHELCFCVICICDIYALHKYTVHSHNSMMLKIIRMMI